MQPFNLFIYSSGLLALCFLPMHAYAVPPEELVTQETIITQTMSDQDVAAPYAITGESLVALIKQMTKFDTEGARVMFNRSTGQMLIRQTPQGHEEVGNILNRIRQAYKQQVEIEAQIITISSTDLEGIGLSTLFIDASRDVLGRLGTIGTDAAFNDQSYHNFIDFSDIVDSASSQGQISFGTLNDHFDFNVFYDLLSTKAEVNTLSSPRIIVTNNQRANITISKAQFYVRELESEATADTEPVVVLKPKIGVAESGTILDVTPTVSADGTIVLELHPTFVRADLSSTKTINIAPSGTLATDEQPFVRLPSFKNQQADTTLTVVNGGTAVIGGLVSEHEVVKDRTIPILSDIPFLRNLVSQEIRTQTRSYLMMFVKATIRDPRLSFRT